MTALAKVLTRASGIEISAEILRAIAIFCGAALLFGLVVATYGIESRPRKSAQDDKWNFCLTTAIVAVNRRNHEQTTPPEPLTGL